MKNMINDNLDEIVELFRQDSDHESKGQPDDNLQSYIRRIRLFRVNKKESSLKMFRSILGKMGNKKEAFIADTRSSVPICHINLANKNGIKLTEVLRIGGMDVHMKRLIPGLM